MLIVFCTERMQHILNIGFFDFYPSRILFIFLIPFFNLNRFFNYASKEVKVLFKITIAYILVVFISALLSIDLIYSIKKWLDTFTVFLFIFLIYNFLIVSSKKVKAEIIKHYFLKYLSVIIILNVTAGIFLIRQIDDGGTVRTIAGINIERRISLFVDANFYCTFLIMAFSMVFFSKLKNRKFLLIILAISILFTGSKGGILALALAFFIYYRRLIPILKSRLFVIGVYTFLLSLIIFAVLKPIQSINYITNSAIFNEENGSGTILPRILAWSSGFKKFSETPLFGIGPGNIINISKGTGNESLLSYVEKKGFYGLQNEAIDKLATHSTYLEVLYEHGIIGFILFIFFIVKLLRMSSRSILVDKYLFLGYHVAFIAFFLSITLLSYSPYFLSFVIGFFLFLVDSNRKKLDDNSLNLSMSHDKI